MFGQSFAYGFVVNGPHDSHVERDCVATDTPPGQECVVFLDHLFGYRAKRQVFALTEPGETVQRAFVVAGRPQAFTAVEPVDLRLNGS